MLMNTQLEMVYERICGMLVCGTSVNVCIKDITSLYFSLGEDAHAFDNMFYERMGLSCEDMVSMLENPDIKI